MSHIKVVLQDQDKKKHEVSLYQFAHGRLIDDDHISIDEKVLVLASADYIIEGHKDAKAPDTSKIEGHLKDVTTTVDKLTIALEKQEKALEARDKTIVQLQKEMKAVVALSSDVTIAGVKEHVKGQK